MSTSFATCQLYGDGSGFNQWISGQVAVITGTPLSHQLSSHFHDEGDEGPATPGDDDDDDDDKDKVSISSNCYLSCYRYLIL